MSDSDMLDKVQAIVAGLGHPYRVFIQTGMCSDRSVAIEIADELKSFGYVGAFGRMWDHEQIRVLTNLACQIVSREPSKSFTS